MSSVPHRQEDHKTQNLGTFHQLIEWARQTDTTPVECSILKALIDRVNLNPEQIELNDLACWPSYDLLVEDTHYSIRTVGQAIRALVKKGLIALGTEPVYPPGKNYEYSPACLTFILKPEDASNMPASCTQETHRQELPTPPAGAAYPHRQELPTPPAGAAYKVLREEKRRKELKEVVMPDTTKDVVPGSSPNSSFFSQFLEDPKTKAKAKAGKVLEPEVLSVGDTLSAAQGGRYRRNKPST